MLTSTTRGVSKLPREVIWYINHVLQRDYDWTQEIYDVVVESGVSVTPPVHGTCTFDASVLSDETANAICTLVHAHKYKIQMDTKDITRGKKCGAITPVSAFPRIFMAPSKTFDKIAIANEQRVLENFRESLKSTVGKDGLHGFLKSKSNLCGLFVAPRHATPCVIQHVRIATCITD